MPRTIMGLETRACVNGLTKTDFENVKQIPILESETNEMKNTTIPALDDRITALEQGSGNGGSGVLTYKEFCYPIPRDKIYEFATIQETAPFDTELYHIESINMETYQVVGYTKVDIMAFIGINFIDDNDVRLKKYYKFFIPKNTDINEFLEQIGELPYDDDYFYGGNGFEADTIYKLSFVTYVLFNDLFAMDESSSNPQVNLNIIRLDNQDNFTFERNVTVNQQYLSINESGTAYNGTYALFLKENKYNVLKYDFHLR